MNWLKKIERCQDGGWHKLIVTALLSIVVSGCASPPRFTSSEQTVVLPQRDRVVIRDHDPIVDEATERETIPAGDYELVADDLDPPLAASDAAYRIPDGFGAELVDDTASPSDRSLPISVSLPDLISLGGEELDSSVSAPSSISTGQPVEHFVALAVSGHPSILAARHRVSAAINRIAQAEALPDPMFNNVFWPIQDQALQTAAGRIGNQMSLTQAVPWPHKLSTKAAIANREVQMARAEVEQLEREIAESVRLAYYEVWYANRAISIVQSTRELVSDLEKVAEARYRSGGTQQDVLRTRLESDRLDDQLVGLVKQKQMSQADLAALVRQPVTLMPETVQELSTDDVPGQLDELIALAEQCNPKLKGLAWEIQRDRQQQRLACLQRYPDLQFGVHWGLISDDYKIVSPVANGHDMISFNVGTTLPIWREKIQAGVREAAHRAESSTLRLEAERDSLYGRLRRLIAQADALVEQRNIYSQRIIPRSEDTLRLAIADYRGERTDFFSLIATYRELLMFETQLARIEANLAGTLAQIDRAVGCVVH